MQNNLTYQKLWLSIGWLLIALIVYLSLTPHPFDPVHFNNSDKVGHLLAYGTLMAWFSQIYRHANQQIKIAMALIGLGIGMEFLQGMTHYRTFDYADMLANSLGVLIGWAVARTSLSQTLAYLDQRISQRQGY